MDWEPVVLWGGEEERCDEDETREERSDDVSISNLIGIFEVGRRTER